MEGKEKRKRLSLISVAIIIVIFILVFGNIFTNIKDKIDKRNYNKNQIYSGYMELLKKDDNSNYTFIDDSKNIRKFTGYSSMSDFYYNVSCVSKTDNTTNKKSYALIDKNENEIVSFGEYDFITQFDEGKFYQVEKNGKQGIINYEGVVIVPLEYDIVLDHKSGEKNGMHAFSCKSSDEQYHYFNESGKEFVTSDKYEAVGFYTTKENSVGVVNILGTLYNANTCEKICATSDIKRFTENIITYDNKFEVYDSNMELVETRECPNAKNITASSYNNKYSIVEITLGAEATEEEIANRFILYDKNGKAILTARDGIAIHEFNNKAYFLKEDDSNVYVLDNNAKEKFVAKNHRLPSRYSDSYYITIPVVGKAQYDLYTKSGRLIDTEEIRSELPKPIGDTEKNYMLITVARKDGGYDTYIMLKDLTKIKIDSNVSIIEQYKNHILTSDSKNNEVKLYNKDKQVIDTFKGVRESQIGTYSIIKNDDSYIVIDLATLKVTFSFKAEELVKLHDNVGVVELVTGFYDLDGDNIN